MVDLAFKGAGVAPSAVVFTLWRFRPSVALGIACGTAPSPHLYDATREGERAIAEIEAVN
jgi:hypothetical protein